MQRPDELRSGEDGIDGLRARRRREKRLRRALEDQHGAGDHRCRAEHHPDESDPTIRRSEEIAFVRASEDGFPERHAGGADADGHEAADETAAATTAHLDVLGARVVALDGERERLFEDAVHRDAHLLATRRFEGARRLAHEGPLLAALDEHVGDVLLSLHAHADVHRRFVRAGITNVPRQKGAGDDHSLETQHEPMITTMDVPRYERIGHQYAQTRREDPILRDRIERALGDARTVVNVGAGTGSYEPLERHVVAIEPSDTMAKQRPRHLAPAIRASAGSLPLRDGSVDAAMTVLSLHHWDEERERGVRELRRVASGRVVVLTYDPRVSGEMWLMKDYFPEVAELDRQIFPLPERIIEWLGGKAETITVPIACDTPDWHLGSFWAHPERVLDEGARNATSGFARAEPEVVERVVSAVRRDLEDGTWDARHGHLRDLREYDGGLRLIVAQ